MNLKDEKKEFIIELILSFIRPLFDTYFVTFDIVLELMLENSASIENVQLEGVIFNKLHKYGKEGQIDSLESCTMNSIKNAIKILQVR